MSTAPATSAIFRRNSARSVDRRNVLPISLTAEMHLFKHRLTCWRSTLGGFLAARFVETIRETFLSVVGDLNSSTAAGEKMTDLHQNCFAYQPWLLWSRQILSPAHTPINSLGVSDADQFCDCFRRRTEKKTIVANNTMFDVRQRNACSSRNSSSSTVAWSDWPGMRSAFAAHFPGHNWDGCYPNHLLRHVPPHQDALIVSVIWNKAHFTPFLDFVGDGRILAHRPLARTNNFALLTVGQRA